MAVGGPFSDVISGDADVWLEVGFCFGRDMVGVRRFGLGPASS